MKFHCSSCTHGGEDEELKWRRVANVNVPMKQDFLRTFSYRILCNHASSLFHAFVDHGRD